MPASPTLVDFAGALPVVLLLSYLIAQGIRRLFGRRISLSISTLTIVAVLGMSLGLLLAGLFLFGQRLWMATTILLVVGCSIGLSFLVAGVAAVVRGTRSDPDIAALIAAGESERVEFKETARWNVREDKKDARMEAVIAKTVAAFLNSDGGTLVIGVDDAGRATGLDRDYATLRTPDADRFELWLRDLLSSTLGTSAAALPAIRFAEVDGAAVCAVGCPRSPEPVFLAQGNATDLWVRVGNSTRSFGVDEAVRYVARHWRPGVRRFLEGGR